MTSRPALSVVVPTYRRRASAERLLRSLARQTLPPDRYEVVLSIDGSEDGTEPMARGFAAPFALRVLRQANRGRAAACNAGIRRAAGEVVVLLDDDMEAAPECLAAHLRAHAGAGRRGVLGAVPVAVSDASAPVARFIAARFDAHLARLARPGHAITIRDFYSGHFSIRREVLLEVGGFDEEFRIYGHEDVELAVRLLAAGVELALSPEAVARQHYEKDFEALARDTVAKGRSAVLCARKHPEASARLKLGTYGEASGKWRLARAALLALSRAWPGTPDLAVAAMTRLERRRPSALARWYPLALDYLYWVGARAALAEVPGPAPAPAPERPARAVARR